MRRTHFFPFASHPFLKHYRRRSTRRESSQWILDSISVKYLRSEMKCRRPEAWLELVWVAPDVTIFTARKAPNHHPPPTHVPPPILSGGATFSLRTCIRDMCVYCLIILMSRRNYARKKPGRYELGFYLYTHFPWIRILIKRSGFMSLILSDACRFSRALFLFERLPAQLI